MTKFDEYNTKYALNEFQQHGELQLMKKLSAFNFQTIFDVGSNIGEWSRMTRQFHPNANLHLFELVPETFGKLTRNGVIDAKMMVNNFGLSHTSGLIDVKYLEGNDRVSSTATELHSTGTLRQCLVLTGQDYLKMHQDVKSIDFLKLDTEGHELDVLRGFGRSIETSVIQFEYGFVAVLTKNLLVDFYRYLPEYTIGRLTPDGVVFKDYHLTDENFNGPDYVAVLRSRQDIIDAIRA